jgi:hypothetical protein
LAEGAAGEGEELADKYRSSQVFQDHAAEYDSWFAEANMSIIEFRSTLYQPPGRVVQEEAPRQALDEQAGFAVIVARRIHV